tara:strand:- start:4791 stop:5177 length:387 start_codon:yes stop_codon:yes gene_type:complete
MSGTLISVLELQKADKAKKQIKKETYRKILEQISKKIQVSSQIGNKNLIVTIPSFVMGFPTFHQYTAANYIIRQLNNGGYKTNRLNDTSIYIDWTSPKEDNKTPENKYEDDLDIPSFVNLKKYAAKYR